MPGGVSSPVRAFKSVGGNPVVFDRVKGAYAWDVDGNKYIDYVGTWGPAILGHADDDVLNAVKETMDKGELALHSIRSLRLHHCMYCSRFLVVAIFGKIHFYLIL